MRPLIFADSTRALAEARRAGHVPADAEIRSFAPAMRGLPGIAAADRDITPDRVHRLERAVLAASSALHADFAATPDEALVLARACIAELSMLAFPALGLTDEDCDRDIGVVVVDFADPGYALRFAPAFVRMTQPDGPFRRIAVDGRSLPDVQEPAPIVAPLRTRLAFAGTKSLGYRLSANVWRRLKRAGPRGSILVVRENELLKDTAFALATRGFAIHALGYPSIDEADAAASAPALDEKFVERVAGFLSGVMPSRVAALIARQFKGRAQLALGRYRLLAQKLSANLAAKAHLRPAAVFSNVKFEPEAVAIRTAARRAGIPSFIFAHGFAAETSAREVDYFARHENALGDMAFVFDRTAKEELDRNPLRVGDCASVGLSSDYYFSPLPSARNDTPPIWYVSTALYKGSMPYLCVGMTDSQLAEHEMSVVGDVLARLPHKVVYKPYPAYRYLDDDPILAHARAQKNIALYLDRIDLRYLLSQARVFVTTRATSTMSWCLFSGRPMLMIDHPDLVPLRDDARAAFAEGAFLVDARKPGWREEAVALLGRPIAGIEAEWARKAPARRELIRRFFSEYSDKDAGRRAADIVCDRIRTRRTAA
jgi:hypothetical protein